MIHSNTWSCLYKSQNIIHGTSVKAALCFLLHSCHHEWLSKDRTLKLHHKLKSVAVGQTSWTTHGVVSVPALRMILKDCGGWTNLLNHAQSWSVPALRLILNVCTTQAARIVPLLICIQVNETEREMYKMVRVGDYEEPAHYPSLTTLLCVRGCATGLWRPNYFTKTSCCFVRRCKWVLNISYLTSLHWS